MTQSKHTPAPWYFNSKRKAITADKPQDIDHEAYRGFNDTAPYNGKYLIAESVVMEANARLIAAAPELLEALKMLLDSTENAISDAEAGSRQNDAERISKARDFSFDVIAKAEGGSCE